jgi:hypothetical protein
MAGGAQDTGGTLRRRLAISAAALLMSMPLAAATVRGTVSDGRWSPANTTITLRVGSAAMTREADWQGKFVFENVPPGECILYADSVGYETARMPLEVGNDDIELAIPLFEKPAPLSTVIAPAGQPWADGAEFFMWQRDAEKLPLGH